jgi:hypothetical protein
MIHILKSRSGYRLIVIILFTAVWLTANFIFREHYPFINLGVFIGFLYSFCYHKLSVNDPNSKK